MATRSDEPTAGMKVIRKRPRRAGCESGREVHGKIEAPGFDLALTLECGQVFGWHKYGETYLGIIDGCAVAVEQHGRHVEFFGPATPKAPRVARYLGLDDDLEAILASVAVDPFMKQVLASIRGLRLLRQEPWHCLCSYLLSASNRVERIDKLVKEIGRRWGMPHLIGGHKIHSLPEPAVLAGCDERGIRSCGAGFRSPFLLGAARRVASGEIDFARITSLPYQEAKQVLMTLDGVGEKIADCILLFAFSKFEAFPVDVWIKKAIEKVYFESKTVSNKEIRRFASDHFGPYAGYAQEYIYAYARTVGLK